MELVMEVAKATRSRRVRSQKRKGAVAETRYRMPKLRPSALREGKEVDALIDAGCCSFEKVSVANAERGTSEGRPSRDRAICLLFDWASASSLREPRLDVAGDASLRLWFSRARTRRKREKRTRYPSAPTTKRALTTTWIICRRHLHPVYHACGTPLWS
jgi:hypothetical protein